MDWFIYEKIFVMIFSTTYNLGNGDGCLGAAFVAPSLLLLLWSCNASGTCFWSRWLRWRWQYLLWGCSRCFWSAGLPVLGLAALIWERLRACNRWKICVFQDLDVGSGRGVPCSGGRGSGATGIWCLEFYMAYLCWLFLILCEFHQVLWRCPDKFLRNLSIWFGMTRMLAKLRMICPFLFIFSSVKRLQVFVDFL